MSYKKQLAMAFIACAFTIQAQDTTSKVSKHRHELGVSVIVPLILAVGATDYNERYTNLSYRYFLSKNHAIKPFVGISTINNVPNNPQTVSSTNTSTLYFMNHTT